MNATDNFFPSALIFPRKKINAEIKDKATTDSVGFAQQEGSIVDEAFSFLLKQSFKFSNISPENKILSLLDPRVNHKYSF